MMPSGHILNGASYYAPGSIVILNGTSYLDVPGSEQHAQEVQPGGLAITLTVASSLGPTTTSSAAGLPSSSSNDLIGGADNKPRLTPNSEGKLGSWDHSVDGPGPYTQDERGPHGGING